MQMPGRSYVGASQYRYGFNGKENDNEVKGSGNSIEYGFRIYDPRLGKFLSRDLFASEYPQLTPYQFASNTPIKAIDLDGLEAYEGPNDAKDVMSLDSWQQFTEAKFDIIKHTDLKARPQYDCADFVLTIMAEYYKEKGVRLLISLPGYNGTVTIDSNNPKYKGENAFDDFLEDIKLNIGANGVKELLSTQIPLEEAAVGDMNNYTYHVQYIYPDAANPPSEPYGAIQASGNYFGRNNPNNLIQWVDLSSYDTWSNNVSFRWNFLFGVPKSHPWDMQTFEPIQIKSIPVQPDNRTIIIDEF